MSERPDLERERTDTRDLDDLLAWLEYGKASGFKAARCSERQEHYWAALLRKKLADAAALAVISQDMLDIIETMGPESHAVPEARPMLRQLIAAWRALILKTKE